MSYGLSLSPLAERQLAAQPEPLRAFTAAALERLAEGPSAVARASAMVSRGRLAEFRFDHAGAVVWLAVVFLYAQDEQTLHIESINFEWGA